MPMLNLIGVFECKVDTKGRLLLAAGLKKQLQPMMADGFVVKRSVFHRCLELYPMKVWNEEVQGVNGLNRFVKKNNDFIRLFMAGVRVVELDPAGRILIPRDLVNFAGISRDIVLASAVDRIEIWDKDGYDKAIAESSDSFADLAEEVMGGQGPKSDVS
jgi:MraZ protein